MRRTKNLISTGVAGVALALAAVCVAAAPVHAAAGPAAEGTAAATPAACPQSPAPFMVDGVPAASAVSITEPFSPPEGASEASCVPPTLNYFGASPNPVDYGGSVTLSWSASSPYPLSCNVSSSLGGFSGGSSGSWTVGPVTASTYFELYCWDAYGDGNTWGLTVGVNGGGGGSSSSVPAGWLDTLTSAGVVGGWSCDWDSVATPIYVHVYADGAFVAQVIANVDRPDVAAATWACNGTGNHGFTYQLPNYLLDGAAHTIQVYGINVDGSGGVVGSGNTELSGSPSTATFTPPPPPPPAITAFSAASAALWSGSSTTLSWSSSGATGCAISSPSGGSWSSLAASGSVVTPALSGSDRDTVYDYTLTCRNAAGSASAGTSVGAFSVDEQYAGSTRAGAAEDPERRSSLDTSGCRWKVEENYWILDAHVGIVIGGLHTRVHWCVKNGRIMKVWRENWTSGPNVPLSPWHFEGYTSLGPCDETCSNWNNQFSGTTTPMNIWLEGHWCLDGDLRFLHVCFQEKYVTVGVLIRGDGTREDTYTH